MASEDSTGFLENYLKILPLHLLLVDKTGLTGQANCEGGRWSSSKYLFLWKSRYLDGGIWQPNIWKGRSQRQGPDNERRTGV